MKKIWPYSSLAFGFIISVVGVIFIVGYVMEAIIGRTGEPDQSLLFWYLPILFMGIIGLKYGLRSFNWGLARLKAIKSIS